MTNNVILSDYIGNYPLLDSCVLTTRSLLQMRASGKLTSWLGVKI